MTKPILCLNLQGMYVIVLQCWSPPKIRKPLLRTIMWIEWIYTSAHTEIPHYNYHTEISFRPTSVRAHKIRIFDYTGLCLLQSILPSTQFTYKSGLTAVSSYQWRRVDNRNVWNSILNKYLKQSLTINTTDIII